MLLNRFINAEMESVRNLDRDWLARRYTFRNPLIMSYMRKGDGRATFARIGATSNESVRIVGSERDFENAGNKAFSLRFSSGQLL